MIAVCRKISLSSTVTNKGKIEYIMCFNSLTTKFFQKKKVHAKKKKKNS